MWILFALASSLLSSAKDIFAKAHLGKSDVSGSDAISTALGQQLIAWVLVAVVFALQVIFTGFPEIKSEFYTTVAILFLISPLWPIIYMKALQIGELTVIAPLMSTIPIFVALESALFGIEYPTFIGWIGIMLLVLGAYTVLLKKPKSWSDWLGPVVRVKYDKAAQYSLLVAIIFSLGGHLGRIIVNSSTPTMAALSSLTASSVGLVLFAAITRQLGVFRKIRNNSKDLSIIGLLHGTSEILTRFSLGIGYTPYVIALLRTNTMWSFAGGVAFFKEKTTIPKILGTLMIVLGSMIIALN